MSASSLRAIVRCAMTPYTTLIDSRTARHAPRPPDVVLFDCRFELAQRRAGARTSSPRRIFPARNTCTSTATCPARSPRPADGIRCPIRSDSPRRLGAVGVDAQLSGDRLRPGQRRVRGAIVVAGALDRPPQGRGARRRHRRLARRGAAARATGLARRSRASSTCGWTTRAGVTSAERGRAAPRPATLLLDARGRREIRGPQRNPRSDRRPRARRAQSSRFPATWAWTENSWPRTNCGSRWDVPSRLVAAAQP